MSPENSEHINYELIARQLSGEASVEENESLRKWLASSPENAAVYARIKLVWVESKEQHFTAENEQHFNSDIAWEKMHKRIQPRAQRIPLYYRWAAVASLILVSFIAYQMYFRSAPNLQIITLDKTYRTELKDESVVVLNKNSELQYSEDFGQTNRKVKLKKGEVFFSVKRDTSLPFIVETPTVDVKVLGTAFNIDCHSEDSTVIDVESGIVQVNKGDQQIRLSKGQRGVYYTRNNRLLKRMIQKQFREKRFWKRSFLDFRGKQLKQVIKTLNDLYDVQIVAHDTVAEKKIHVQFKNEDLETMMEIIKITLDLQMEERNGIYHLSSTDSNSLHE